MNSCDRRVIRLFFLENEQGEAVTVNGHRYWAMLNEFLFTKNVTTFNDDPGHNWWRIMGAWL